MKLCGLFMCAAAVAARTSSVTPMQKVLDLLVKLRNQVQEEGTHEASAYDKFACFCKEQANNKAYAIAKSDHKVDDLTATKTALEAEVTQLNNDVTTRKGDITTEAAAANVTAATRQSAYALYEVQHANLTESVAAVGSALDALRSNKDEWFGSHNEVNPALIQKALAAIPSVSVAFFGNASDLEDTVKMDYKSKDIIAILHDLLRQFKAELTQLDEDESTAAHDHNMIEGARAQKIKAYESEIIQKEKVSAYKSEEISKTDQLLTQTSAARTADQAFLDELTATCQSKATTWDQRSTARAAEIQVMTEAIQTLEAMGATYSVNAKLVGLISHPPAQKPGRLVVAKEHHAVAAPLVHTHASTPHSFIQASHTVLPRVLKFVGDKATALHSSALASLAIALRSKSGDDHFVEVRAIIQDLIAKLEADALAEADQKTICDTGIANAVSGRDAAASEMERLKAEIELTNANIHVLSNDIEGLAKEVADLYKALNEMTELRQEESARNQQTVLDASAAAAAVQSALSALQEYYGTSGASLIQYVPPNADQYGNTVSDLAPDSGFSGNYTGKATESKGITGLLEVILSDFERTASTVNATEIQQQADFDTQSASINTDITARETTKGTKEGDKTIAEATLVTHQDDLSAQTTLHTEALAELDNLKAMCVDAAESWEQRNQHRKDEIEALKQALTILENWQS